MFYRVKIEKKRQTEWIEKKLCAYHWEVEVFKDSNEDTRQEWDLRGGGYASTSARAKQKALKHLLGVEKDVANGLEFGVVLTTSGSADDVMGKLRG